MTQACATCRHFTGDPRALEQALPGLTAMSSAYGATRGDDGLCGKHDRFCSARSQCGDWAPVTAADGP